MGNDDIGHKPYWPQPYRPQTTSATNHIGHSMHHIGHTQCRYRPQVNENEMPATAWPLFFMFPLTSTSGHLKLLLKYIKINENACVGVAKFGTITQTWSEFTNFNLWRQYSVHLSVPWPWVTQNPGFKGQVQHLFGTKLLHHSNRKPYLTYRIVWYLEWPRNASCGVSAIA